MLNWRNQLPSRFTIKDWFMWVLLWMSVGFFTGFQLASAWAGPREPTGPLCEVVHPADYCARGRAWDRAHPEITEERLNRIWGGVGQSLQGAGNALQQGGAPMQQQFRMRCHQTVTGTIICNY